MYPNDLTSDLVQARRNELISEADSYRRNRLVAKGDGWSIVIVRRALGGHLIRLGDAVTGETGGPVCSVVEPA